jgi:(p)ppGpp synthase/HD superfamily hydrolase
MTGDYPPDTRRDIVCTSWLHDILEDTTCPYECVEVAAGYQVAHWVRLLTEPTIEGDRKERKKFYAGVLSQAPDEVKIVKLCDIVDNTLGITAFDPEFAQTYVAEKEFLLQHLTCGNEPLHRLAERVVRHERIALNRHLGLPLLGGEEATY